MGLVLCFLENSLFFLLCSGTLYLVSSLVRVLLIREMKFLSLFFMTQSPTFFSTDLDNRDGDVLDSAGATELETPEQGTDEVLGFRVSREIVTGGEALIDTSKVGETSASATSGAQTVQ